jgi:hypothetical protein
VRPTLVIIDPPCLDDRSDVIEIYKPVLVQAFVPELAVEALHETIIDRLARADELQPDSVRIRPAIHGVADELGAVIDHDLLRQAMNSRYPRQNLDNPLTTNRGVGLNPETLLRIGVNDRQQPEPSSGMQGIMQEVHRPQLTGALGLRKFNAALGRPFTSSAYPDRELFFPVNPFRAFLVNDEPFAFQKQVESTATESPALLGKLSHPPPKSLIPIRPALMTEGVSTKTNQSTGTALTQPKAVHDINCGFPACLGL